VSAVTKGLRWQQLEVLQEHYKDFCPFLDDAMAQLGFTTSQVQRDIAQYMERGPQYCLIEAARGQAKSTIAVAFVLWTLIHSPSHRVLLLSSTYELATQNVSLAIQLLRGWDILECLRPSKASGDRTSITAFDVHAELKGFDRTPSLSCTSILGGMAGRRADLTLLDDVESDKNSDTPGKRLLVARGVGNQFALNISGRMIFLGTPQCKESLYNSLPSRGVSVRIWPGRYPTPAQLPHYAGCLAPSIVQRLAEDPSLGGGGGIDGAEGKPIDPAMNSESILLNKARSPNEPGWYELQYMLDTTMSDATRHPLKTSRCVVLESIKEQAPLSVTRSVNAQDLRTYSSAGFAFELAPPCATDPDQSPYTSVWAAVDPAAGGANGDETAWVVCGLLNSTVYVIGVGSVAGGYAEDTLTELARQLSAYALDGITIEKNLGHGAFAAAFTPVIRKLSPCAIKDVRVSGRKEKRIIQVLGPIISRGSLVFDSDTVEQDSIACSKHSLAKRTQYSLFYQLSKIQDVASSLAHDDRLDALALCCMEFQDALVVDVDVARDELNAQKHAEFLLNPFGDSNHQPHSNNMFDKWRL
jgi:hypothetical protein